MRDTFQIFQYSPLYFCTLTMDIEQETHAESTCGAERKITQKLDSLLTFNHRVTFLCVSKLTAILPHRRIISTTPWAHWQRSADFLNWKRQDKCSRNTILCCMWAAEINDIEMPRFSLRQDKKETFSRRDVVRLFEEKIIREKWKQ